MIRWRDPGVLPALGAAVLFGCATPLAKLLLGETTPWLLAGLLYLGSGVGLLVLRVIRGAPRVRLGVRDAGWLAGAIVTGGMIAPVLLMWGLTRMPASGTSLLLNAEGVLTALLAWFLFRENFDRRIALGMLMIVAGAGVLSWPGHASFGAVLPALSVLAACLAWAIDNNLTRKVSLADPTFIAMTKGLAAGTVNLLLALLAGASMPALTTLAAAAALGFVSYGVSLVLFVIGLRHLGTARTGAYFSIAPFAGAVVAVAVLDEPVTATLLVSGALMACGVWLHLTERHEHRHVHEPLEHEHEHEHDAHHQHDHPHEVAPGTHHTHRHQHQPVNHTHAHFPDAHHRHRH